MGAQIGYLVLLYPLYLLTIFVTCGLYIIPIFYGITRRTYITGDFMYERGSSDTLDMIISVRKNTAATGLAVNFTTFPTVKREFFSSNLL